MLVCREGLSLSVRPGATACSSQLASLLSRKLLDRLEPG